MSIDHAVMSWLGWRKAVDLINIDKETVNRVETKIPNAYGGLLDILAKAAYRKAIDEFQILRNNKVKIVSEETKNGEYYLNWRYRGEAKVMCLTSNELKKLTQDKLDELSNEIMSGRNGDKKS